MSTFFDISTRRSRMHVIYGVVGLVLLGLHTNAVYMLARYPEGPPDGMPVQVVSTYVVLFAWIVIGIAALPCTLGSLAYLVYRAVKAIREWVDAGKPDPEPIPGFTYVPASSPYDDTGC